MITLKWNGEYWYEDRTPLLSRIATWLIWIGGTQTSPTPISVFGHRVTFYGWGANVRFPSGDLLVISWCGLDPKRWWRSKPASVYVSPNGTPDRAHTWLVGAPREVREAAALKAGRRAAMRNWRPDHMTRGMQS